MGLGPAQYLLRSLEGGISMLGKLLSKIGYVKVKSPDKLKIRKKFSFEGIRMPKSEYYE